MLKHFQILTADQRKILEAGRADMEKRMADMQAKMKANTKFSPAYMQTKMLDGLAKKLTLTDEQKIKLKDVFTANKPAEPATMMTKMQESQKAIQNELNSGKATVDSLKVILNANMHEDRLDKHLEVLVKVHDILTADQRKLAGSFPMFDGGFGKKGGHGFGFGKGPKGGHGPEMMGGFGGKGGFTPPPFF